MCSNEKESNDVNGSQLAEQGPSSGRCSRQGEAAKFDKVLKKFKIHGITKTNELLYPGAVAVTNRLGMKVDKVAGRKGPTWK